MNLEPLSYFFGALLGDGNLWKHKTKNSRMTSIACADKDIITRCYFDVLHFFHDVRKGRLYETPQSNEITYYRIVWTNYDFYDFCNLQTNGKRELPEYIWTASKEAKLAMLSGIMDTDGSINNDYRLKLSGKDQFVAQSFELFHDVGINTGKLLRQESTLNGKYYDSLFYFYASTLAAIEAGFYFRCRRKQYRLEEFMTGRNISYVYPHDIISDIERGGDPSKY